MRKRSHSYRQPTSLDVDLISVTTTLFSVGLDSDAMIPAPNETTVFLGSKFADVGVKAHYSQMMLPCRYQMKEHDPCFELSSRMKLCGPLVNSGVAEDTTRYIPECFTPN